VRKADTTLPPSRAVVMTSGNLKFLEPSGPLQACNGNALLFFYVHEINEDHQCGYQRGRSDY
jgi:hypothetical protein